MEIKSKFFGIVSIDQTDIIDFREGIPGFEDQTSFVILNVNEDEGSEYKILQSMTDEQVAFIIVNPWNYEPTYEFKLSSYVKEKLQITGKNDINVFSIVTASKGIRNWSMNLLAPIVLNSNTKQGMQVVLDGTMYTTKHFIRNEAE
ncbi:MAG: flagellar assembly protein FliW [Turicibacter sp.]